MKIAFIVPRYGTEILGGAEYHCRLGAERMAERHQVDVLTTCARDATTWQNEYPEAPDRIRGVMVRRFANAQTRDPQAFDRLSARVLSPGHTAADEAEWLREGATARPTTDSACTPPKKTSPSYVAWCRVR